MINVEDSLPVKIVLGVHSVQSTLKWDGKEWNGKTPCSCEWDNFEWGRWTMVKYKDRNDRRVKFWWTKGTGRAEKIQLTLFLHSYAILFAIPFLFSRIPSEQGQWE